MNVEELLKALEIRPDELDTLENGNRPAGADRAPAAPRGPASRTALKLDEWSLRRGKEALDGELGTITADKHAAADFLGAAFEPDPQLAESCTDPLRRRFLESLLDSEEYRGLHAETQLSHVGSEMAACSFARSFAAYEAKEKAVAGHPGDSEDGRNRRAMLAAAAAAGRASQEAEDAADMERALGLGRGCGNEAGAGGATSLADVRSRFNRVQRSTRLRIIMELAGRFRLAAQAAQRRKVIHGRDDVVGVVMDNDLGRILPHELAALDDPDLEYDVLRRYLERGLMCREYRGVEARNRGPIFICIDESMSMDGRSIALAKAFALGMGWIAQHQNRWFGLVAFAVAKHANYLVMRPGKWDQTALLDWLAHFFGGGTSYHVPLTQLPERWEKLGCPKGKTDIILITDGLCDIDETMRANFLAWKVREKAKLFSIVLNCGDKAGRLPEVSDRVWTVPDLELEQDCIQELLAL